MWGGIYFFTDLCILDILGLMFSSCLFLSSRPLHIAARNGLATVVQALLNRGATVLAVDEEGTPPSVCTPNHRFRVEAHGCYVGKTVASCTYLIFFY